MKRRFQIFIAAACWLVVCSSVEAQWQPAGFLREPRNRHTATVLPSGQVLIAGGLHNAIGSGFTSAEIFDPGTGKWRFTGSLNAGRLDHTATLLASGQVLVAGGILAVVGGGLTDLEKLNSGSSESSSAIWDPPRSAEIYDPESETWKPVGNLESTRSSHTATLLPSGKVLIVGGQIADNSHALATAEIFDPDSESWQDAASMGTPRLGHTATLLPSGKVLVVGGNNPGINGAFEPVLNALIYDPETDTWMSAGNLANHRINHSATLLPSGKVLVTGGNTTTADVELFDPETNTWQLGGMLSHKWMYNLATLLPSGNVLITGAETPTPRAELYDPITGTTSSTGNPGFMVRYSTSSLLPSGDVLIVGGDVSKIYSEFNGRWQGTSSPNLTYWWHDAILLRSGKVLIVEGTQVELYDPATETWTMLSATTGQDGSSATLLLNGKILVVGLLCSLFDPEAAMWTPTSCPKYPRTGLHSATRLPSGKVLVVGEAAVSEVFDPETSSWQVAGEPRQPRIYHSATLLNSGKVLIAGGLDSNSSAIITAELYDPYTNSWSASGELAVPATLPTSALLPGGLVLLTSISGTGEFSINSQLYDPITETWIRSASFSEPMGRPTLTLLPSGQVLAVGGSTRYEMNTGLYNPGTGTWSPVGGLASARELHAATLLPSGDVLITGGFEDYSLTPAEVFLVNQPADSRRPTIESWPKTIRFGEPFEIEGRRFRGDSEGSGGSVRSSATNYPLVQLRSLDGKYLTWLNPAPRSNFWDDPMTLSVSELPDSLMPGPHFLTVVVSGVASEPKLIDVECSIAITGQPQNQVVELGSTATISIEAQGARRYQWQKNSINIPGANARTFTTLPITAADAGTKFRVIVDSLCTSAASNEITVTIADSSAPQATVISPVGGEYWPLSRPTASQTQTISWSMTDNIRVCKVEAALLYSNNGGQSWLEAPAGGGLPATFGQAGSCPYPGVESNSLAYTVPQTPPSGSIGSLYKIRVRATDQAGNVREALSENPFFIVQPNPDSVQTLILHNLPRMRSVQGISPTEAAALTINLQDLANHPRVLGRLVDLSLVPSLTAAYAAWDGDTANTALANGLVQALRAYLRSHLLPTFTGVRSIVVVGDDRIFPMARLGDNTVLPESSYFLSTNTTVGQALEQSYYLSDDPLGVRGPLDLPLPISALGRGAFLPELAVGRLVEEPSEIIHTIATFISQDGLLDLGTPGSPDSRRVMVSGYDFLTDSAARIEATWQAALGNFAIDGSLIGQDWGESDLKSKLSEGFAIYNLNGHATHFEEGVPGPTPTQIDGLDASEIYGPHACGTSTAVNLPGAVVYAVGCHGGLPVAGSCSTDADHSLDLPQTLMARGALAYIANSGYGWGLRHGIGLGERLVEIFTEEMLSGGTISTGEAFVRSKRRYFLEQPGLDVYDQKTLLQWTFFGLPMYSVRTGINPATAIDSANSTNPASVTVERKIIENLGAPLPNHLVALRLLFNLSAEGIYRKYDSRGVLATGPGCADPNGCYYTLNDLSERSTDSPDIPIQPYLVYESRLAGTSQHGALWLGGEYEEEGGWIPVLAELASNGGVFSDHGSTPRLIKPKPFPQVMATGEAPECRASDLELNTLVTVVGEAYQSSTTGNTYDRQRIYRDLELELFYFNDQGLGANCDRTGPTLAPANGVSFHEPVGSRIDWAVAAQDLAGVWRVVVVFDLGPDSEGRGTWQPLELTQDVNGIWRGSLVTAAPRLTYMIQAVDRRGNVEWLDFVPTTPPASGIDSNLPLPIEVETSANADLSLSLTDSPDPAAVGSLVAHTLVTTNLGPDSANHLRLTVQLPPALAYGLAGGTGWTCGQDGGTLTCQLEHLAAGQSATAVVYTEAVAGGMATTFARVNALETDPISTNDQAIEQTFIASNSDLSVAKSDNGALAIPGEILTYTISATNRGPQAVSGALVTDNFPVGLSDISWTCVATPGSFCSEAGSGDITDVVHLLSGGTAIYRARTRVDLDMIGPITNSATITGPAGDPEPGNNTSVVLTPYFNPRLLFSDGFESGDTLAWDEEEP